MAYTKKGHHTKGKSLNEKTARIMKNFGNVKFIKAYEIKSNFYNIHTTVMTYEIKPRYIKLGIKIN